MHGPTLPAHVHFVYQVHSRLRHSQVQAITRMSQGSCHYLVRCLDVCTTANKKGCYFSVPVWDDTITADSFKQGCTLFLRHRHAAIHVKLVNHDAQHAELLNTRGREWLVTLHSNIMLKFFSKFGPRGSMCSAQGNSDSKDSTCSTLVYSNGLSLTQSCCLFSCSGLLGLLSMRTCTSQTASLRSVGST